MKGLKKYIVLIALIAFGGSQFFGGSAIADSVTQADKQKVEQEILKLQEKLGDTLKGLTQVISDTVTESVQYETKGDFGMSIKINDLDGVNGDINIELNDYLVKNDVFDSDMSGKLSFNIDFDDGYDHIKGSVSADFSAITKDGDYYILINNLQTSNIDDPEIQAIVDEISEMFPGDTYIKIPGDPSSQVILEVLRNFFSLDTFNAEIDNILSQPFFEAVEKTGDTYTLIPSKYACDTFFRLGGEIERLMGMVTISECSQSVYDKFLKDFAKENTITLTLGDKQNEFAFVSSNSYDEGKLTITYNDDALLGYNFTITPNKGGDDEIIELSYEKGSNFVLNAHDGEEGLKFFAELNKDNKIVSATGELNIDDVFADITIKDHKLSARVIVKNYGYDYHSDNFDYGLTSIVAMKVNGNYSKDYDLDNISFVFGGIEASTKRVFFLGNLSVRKDVYSFGLSFDTEEDGTVIVDGTGKYAPNYFTIDTNIHVDNDYLGLYVGNINFGVDMRDSKYNFDFGFNLKEDGEALLSFVVKNTAKRSSNKNIQITAPTHYEELDLFGGMYDYGDYDYGDYDYGDYDWDDYDWDDYDGDDYYYDFDDYDFDYNF